MSKRVAALSLTLGFLLSLAACSAAGGKEASPLPASPSSAPANSTLVSPADTSSIPAPDVTNATQIILSDTQTTVDGAAISTDPAAAVYAGAAIIYYEAGHDETYGEGTEADSHTPEEAAAHTVITITQPGVYRVSGRLSAGQLAIDLGSNASTNPEAVVTLLLDSADITCSVAPAVIFYNVYECLSADIEAATPTVDTTAAGANVVIADGSVNTVNGSYVAKIYQEGTDKKLHKYDGAFYSKMSMNVFGQSEGTGTLAINAANEGLDSELHLTINSGTIHITANNDGINTNEDGVSVTTVNGGYLTVSGGLGAEGDGIDSNGYLVINGGTVITSANSKTGDGGIDADSGIYLNGGTVLALGSRNDEAQNTSAQTLIQLSFAQTQAASSTLSLQNAEGTELLYHVAEREFSSVTFSSPDLKTGVPYTLYADGIQQQFTGTSFGMFGGMGSGMDGSATPPDTVSGATAENPQPPADGTMPTDRPQRPDSADGATPPNGGTPPDVSPRPDGGRGGSGDRGDLGTLTPSTDFTLTAKAYSFSGITDKTQS